jgi:hypothetical protein
MNASVSFEAIYADIIEHDMRRHAPILEYAPSPDRAQAGGRNVTF